MDYFESNPLKRHLHTIIQTTKADAEKRFAKAKAGITPLQYGVLAMTKPGPITMNEIAHQFNFKAPSLVPAVDALEQTGLLHRKDDPEDRRKIQLIITRKGMGLLKRLPLDEKKDALNRAFRKLPSAKQKQLLALLKELIENF